MSCDHCGGNSYLVTGLTRECGGELVVSAVVEVRADVVDTEPGDRGWYRWADTVVAADPDAAEEAAHRLYRAQNGDD